MSDTAAPNAMRYRHAVLAQQNGSPYSARNRRTYVPVPIMVRITVYLRIMVRVKVNVGFRVRVKLMIVMHGLFTTVVTLASSIINMT